MGEGKTLGLQLGDGGLELGDRGADVGELDDVRLGRFGEFAEFGEGIGDALVFFQKLGESAEDASGEGDVARFHGDARRLRKGLNDRQQRVSREGGGFVGLRVEDGGSVGHGQWKQ